MKKKIALGLMTAVLAAGMVFSFTACGVNGSPESVVKAYIEAMAMFDAEGYADTIYFANDTLKQEFIDDLLAEDNLEEDGDSAKGGVKDFEMTTEELGAEEKQAMIDFAKEEGVVVTDVLSYTATFNMDVTIVDKDGEEVDSWVGEDESEGVVYKINGGWYVYYFGETAE